jgi:hypothetical protein
LFGWHRRRFEAAFPSLAIREVRPTSLLAYPLSGGFRRWSLVPKAIIGPLLRIEDCLAPLLGRLLAFRLIVVLERTEPVRRRAPAPRRARGRAPGGPRD